MSQSETVCITYASRVEKVNSLYLREHMLEEDSQSSVLDYMLSWFQGLSLKLQKREMYT